MKQILLFDTAIATTNLRDGVILESVKVGLIPILKKAMIFRLGTHVENYSIFQMRNSSWKYHELCQKADYKVCL